MSLAVRPLHPIFAVEIVGADLATEADEELVRTVENAMAEYAVCIVRDASLSDDDHIRFSRAFGPLELPPKMGRFTVARRLRRELFDASNLGCERRDHPVHSEARRIARGAERFHTDSSFNKLPTKWSLLLGHTVPPEGGDTHFIDTRAVYDALPQETRNKIETLVGIHDFWRARERTSGLANITAEQRASLPPVMHRLVRTMPYGRKSLYIGGHAVGIVGWPDDEAVALLDNFMISPRRTVLFTCTSGGRPIWSSGTIAAL
ncbi:MAG TPA: TauD/TfdA family dioxygenase [Rhizomicrobium sp.]|jgi:alpha-ketoglutarate-dependent 2,4-dichlorophenoxyacetate dioxygenase